MQEDKVSRRTTKKASNWHRFEESTSANTTDWRLSMHDVMRRPAWDLRIIIRTVPFIHFKKCLSFWNNRWTMLTIFMLYIEIMFFWGSRLGGLPSPGPHIGYVIPPIYGPTLPKSELKWRPANIVTRQMSRCMSFHMEQANGKGSTSRRWVFCLETKWT